MNNDVAYWLLAGALVAIGLAGSVLPAIPGVPLVFAGLLTAAWIDDFERVGVLILVILGVLTALSFLIDIGATMLGAKRVGASKRAIVGAALGTLAGLFIGLPGLILGPFVGAVIGEFSAHGELQRAARAGLATWVGLLFGTLAKLALVFTMLGVFATAYFF